MCLSTKRIKSPEPFRLVSSSHVIFKTVTQWIWLHQEQCSDLCGIKFRPLFLSIHQYAKMPLCVNCKTVCCSHSKLACFSNSSLSHQLFRNTVNFSSLWCPAMSPASVDGNWSSVSGKVTQVKPEQYKIDENWIIGKFFLFVKFQSWGGRTSLVYSHKL